MKRKLMPIAVASLLCVTFFCVNPVAWSFERHVPNAIPQDQILPPSATHSEKPAAFCLIINDTDTPAYFYDSLIQGSGTAVYMNPEYCGPSPYPFKITGVHFYLYEFDATNRWPVALRVNIRDTHQGDSCIAPGEVLCYQDFSIESSLQYPETVELDLSGLCCVDQPFFLEIVYTETFDLNHRNPSLLMEPETPPPDTCDNWMKWDGEYWEWWDFWSPPPPGNTMIRVTGYTQDQDCEDLWYWKPDTAHALSGMPDFDQNQDEWIAYCGPAAVANCLWWFDAVPEGMTPPELIEMLAEYFHTNPSVGTYVDSMQIGLDQYFSDYGLALYESTFEEPDFFEMEDSLKRCQDIILLLGFWYYDEQAEEWSRHGGHFVTTAGVCSEFLQIAISDPNQDAAESGWPGRVRPQDHQPHPGDPLVHNNPSFVCHDMYQSILDNPFPSPGNPFWEIDYQWSKGQYSGQNVPEKFRSVTRPVTGDGKGIFATEVEYAVMICPKEITPPGFTVGVLQNPVFSAELNIYSIASESLKTAPTITIGSDTLPVDEIRFGETTIYWSNYRLTASGEIEIKVVGTDLANNEGSHTETFSAGSILPSGGNVVSHDNLLRLEVPSGAVEKEEYFLIFKTDDRAGTNDKLQSYLVTQQLLLPSVSWDGAGADIISPAYSITPSRFKLRSRAKLSFDYTGFDLEGRDPSRLTVYLLEGEVWTPVPTYLDSDQRRVVAFVDQLGLYQLRYAKVQDQNLAPTTYALRNNYPNPFNNATTIRYEISSPGWLKIDIYNTLGQRVRTLVNEHVPTGRYIVDWDGTNEREQSVSSGIYFYTLKVNDFTETKKMLFLK